MSDEVINLWIPIKRLDSESCYPTVDLISADSNSFRHQSLKEEEEESEAIFKPPSFEVLLDNRSKFGESSAESTSSVESTQVPVTKQSDDSVPSVPIEVHGVRSGSALSDFDDGVGCGEPFVPQCLVYDFTPRPEDEAVSLKCSKFWNYVYSRPELSQYKVYPSTPVTTEDSDISTTEELNSKENEDQDSTRHAPVKNKAIKWLAEGKTSIMEMKRCQKYCESYAYPEDKDPTESETETALGSDITRPQTRQVKALCKEMASFDEAHPRDLDPPLHLSFRRAVLRNLTNLDKGFKC